MLFPTLDYLLFLPLSVALFWCVGARWRLWVVVASSLAFYASWSVDYLPALLWVTGLAWVSGHGGRGLGRVGWWLLLAGLLGPLVVVKYWDWLAWNAETLLGGLGLTLGLPRWDLALPVGISFFTFQALAYAVDVRRGREGPQPPLAFLGFITFFPQLVAGPIVRVQELVPQLTLRRPQLRRGDVGEGTFRIAEGMVKKLLIADMLQSSMVDPVFADPQTYSGLEVLIALYAYTLQIYCDFSAYTDIAIGSARLFGIRLPENFSRPYLATSVAEFWRRWHITLSSWVRDYIYYPLGGSQVDAPWKVYRNILATMVVIGIWHGASWNFVVYGLLHGGAVSVNRWQRKRTGRRPFDAIVGWWPWLWRFLLTFHFVVLCRILFRTEDLAGAAALAGRLLEPGGLLLPRFAPTAWLVLGVGYALHFAPPRWMMAVQQGYLRLPAAGQALVAALAAALCWHMGTRDQLAFIYYQF